MKTSLLYISIALLVICCNDPVTAIKSEHLICVSDSMSRMITIDTVTECKMSNELKLSGEVSFDENKIVKIFPVISGQVSQVRVSLGDHVNAGQVLAIIRSAEITSYYNDLRSANADLSIAKRQWQNQESLFNSGISSQREYEESKQNYEKALSLVNKITQQLHINGNGRTDANGDFIVVAPRSGYILEKKISTGAFIRNDNADYLFSIGDIGDVWIWANVYESDIAKVKQGYTARVTTIAYPDSVFTGKVDKVSQFLDPQSKVMKVRIVLSNKNASLKPEMFANISIENEEGEKALCIPSSAIVSDFGKNFIIVYRDRCNLMLREISVVKAASGKTFISGDIAKGERVLSSNQVLFFRALMEK